jgi:replicative DNA helicase
MSELSGYGPTVGRSPPANLDAERSALGGILIKPSAVDELVTGLTADDFFLPSHREIFEAILALEKRRQPIDIISLADELKTRGSLSRLEGGAAYIVELANTVPTAENIEHYIRIVREKATLRRLIAACAEIQSRAFGEFGNYEEFLDEAETQVFKVVQQTRRDTYHPTAEMVPEVLESIEQRSLKRSEITGVPTGFTGFDKITAGLQPENLIVVAARPGVGKTTWAVNVAVSAAVTHKIPVLIFSLEMSRYELMERMLAGESRIDSGLLKRGLIQYSDWKNKIYPAGSRLAQAPIVVDDSGAPTILDIRAKARRFRHDPRFFSIGPAQGVTEQQQHGLIVVDYLQLARGATGRKDESREREIADISRGLKALAKDLKVPVIAVSQLNRGLEKREDKRPQLSDLRESGAIEQDADMIVFIHRDDYFDRESENRGKAELIIGKHRHGATGTVPLTFIREYTKFENFSDEESSYGE